MAASKSTQEHPLANILINVLIPVLALGHLSKDPELQQSMGKAAHLWHIGPRNALCVALLFPIGYGVWHFIRTRQMNFFSALGLLSVILTGGLTLYLWNEDGTVKKHAALLFGMKEASIPLILSAAVLGSHFTQQPLLRTFLYSDSLFDIRKIERRITETNGQREYQRILLEATLLFSGSFLLSTALNFGLALYFLGGLDHNASNARELYNEQVARITGWGFAVIGLPILCVLFLTLRRMLKRLHALTGLERDELMLPR
jgi:hypothetical protein